jgi:hypothetical protein
LIERAAKHAGLATSDWARRALLAAAGQNGNQNA